jgi:hypothetical protein
MKTFEEKWTAWIDGELTGAELIEFEASLPDKAAAEAEKRDAHQLGTFLKEHLPCRAMGNEEFFHHQLRERMTEDAVPARAEETARAGRVWWPIGRLVWVGATALAIFTVCAVFVMREKPAAEPSQYLSEILTARVDPAISPNATISMFKSQEDKVTVLWVDGLQSLPSEYASQ